VPKLVTGANVHNSGGIFMRFFHFHELFFLQKKNRLKAVIGVLSDLGRVLLSVVKIAFNDFFSGRLSVPKLASFP